MLEVIGDWSLVIQTSPELYAPETAAWQWASGRKPAHDHEQKGKQKSFPKMINSPKGEEFKGDAYIVQKISVKLT